MQYGQIEFAEVSAEYKEFVEKFKPNKTTDDCYTPENVYNAIVNWAVEEYGIDPAAIIRPFYPGGDYERHNYPVGGVVLDNPPFSIITPIVRFYEANNIKYFLFAPHLTNFQIPAKCHIMTDARITYENGATVNTAFVTNLDHYAVRSCPKLCEVVRVANAANIQTKKLPKYKYPLEVLTSARCGYYAAHGVDYQVEACDLLPVRRLDAQTGTTIFGSGFLLSEEATRARAEAERIARENIMRDAEKIGDGTPIIIWELSEREKEIIKRLGRQSNGNTEAKDNKNSRF